MKAGGHERRIAVLVIVSLTAVACATARIPPPTLPDAAAADYITAAFQTHPLVAFSEPGHGASGTREFLAALIRHPGFAGVVNDIVIECGNARYQRIADRYFSGGAVERDELKQIWEETTIVSGVWQLPMYEAVLADIRAYNMTLPEAHRLRVVLGDPPIDWDRVRGPADEDMNDWRDAHFAWVVQEQVIKRGRRALLWIGGAHTSRRVMLPDSVIHLLDQRLPNKTLVIHAVDRGQVSAAVAARLRQWPSQRISPVRDTWLGRLDVAEIGHHLSSGLVEDDIDAVLFWDPPPSSRDAPPVTSHAGPASPELRRRQELSVATLPFRGGRIRFQVNSAAFTAESRPALNAVAAELKRDPRLNLLITAFADGSEPDGLSLSVTRAGQVVTWLTKHGIDGWRLVAKGCGSSRSLWVGHTEEQRAANRRADLVRQSELAGCQRPSSFLDFYRDSSGSN